MLVNFFLRLARGSIRYMREIHYCCAIPVTLRHTSWYSNTLMVSSTLSSCYFALQPPLRVVEAFDPCNPATDRIYSTPQWICTEFLKSPVKDSHDRKIMQFWRKKSWSISFYEAWFIGYRKVSVDQYDALWRLSSERGSAPRPSSRRGYARASGFALPSTSRLARTVQWISHRATMHRRKKWSRIFFFKILQSRQPVRIGLNVSFEFSFIPRSYIMWFERGIKVGKQDSCCVHKWSYASISFAIIYVY